MHKEVLSSTQAELLPLLAKFKREYYLVGGTAIALQIGHRRSIDFDLFKKSSLNPKSILEKIITYNFPRTITRNVSEQLNVTVNGVKLTFYQYPFNVISPISYEHYFRMPDLLSLAAMKAYALGRPSKWKDYVDLFFIISNFYTIEEITRRAKEIFDDMFIEKLFRAQLCFFEDIDYSEPIDYLVPSVSEDEIKDFLINKATDI